VEDETLSQKNITSFVTESIRQKEGQWNDVTTSQLPVQSLVGVLTDIFDDQKSIDALGPELELAKNPPIPEPAPVLETKGKKGSQAAIPVAPAVDEEAVGSLLNKQNELTAKVAADKERYSHLFEDLIPKIGPMLQNLVLAKNDFHGWAGDEKTVVSLNADAVYQSQVACFESANGVEDGVWASNPLYARYREEMAQLPAPLHQVNASLYSIVRSVVSDLRYDKWGPSPLNHSLTQEGVVKVVLDCKDTGKLSTLSALHAEANRPLKQNADVIICEQGDTFQLLAARAFKCHPVERPNTTLAVAASAEADTVPEEKSHHKEEEDLFKPTAGGLVTFSKHARFRAHINRVLGERKFPRYSRLSAVEMGIQRTELLSFTSLSTTDFYRAHQLWELHQMLLHCATNRDDFTGSLKQNSAGDNDNALQRRYYSHISPFAFQQIMAAQLLKEPDIVRQYYPFTDDLLMVLHWVPPNRRMAHRTWNASMSVRMRQSFREYEHLKAIAAKSNKEVDKPAPCINISKQELQAFARDSVFLTPAGKAMAFINRVSTSNESWITITVDDSIIGLRKPTRLAYPVKPKEKKSRGKSARNSAKATPSTSGAGSRVIEDEFGATDAKPVPIREMGLGGLAGSSVVSSKMSLASGSVMDLPGGNEPACKSACFFCDLDGSRFVVTSSDPKDISLCKPDKKGTVCITAAFASGLNVAVGSDNTIRMSDAAAVDKPALARGADFVGDEVSRFIAAGGVVTRTLINSPIGADVYHVDGSRTLVRNPESTVALKGFYGKLLSEAPTNWTYVRLDSGGKILFFKVPPGTLPEPNGVAPHSMKQILKASVDAETHAEVLAYRDGRTVVKYVDGLTDLVFPDHTKMTLHPTGSHLCISRDGLPTVEMDVFNDRTCYGHSNGLQVALSKSGDCVRSLVSCPDGTAIVVKYDITVTTEVNGSLKLVSRDRTVIKAYDGGEVVYLARTSWDQKAEDEFAKECKDTSAPVSASALASTLQSAVTFEVDNPPQSTVSTKKKGTKKKRDKSTAPGATATTMATAVPGTPPVPPPAAANAKETFYNFNVDKLTCHIQDYEYNHFYLSLADTKPAPAPDACAPAPALKKHAKQSSMKMPGKQTSIKGQAVANAADNVVPNNPLEPVLNLSGEVAGMKPTAVTDSPIEPRLYVLHRDGSATEAVSNMEVTERDNFTNLCPDMFCVTKDIVAPPCDLGGGRMTTYFNRKRMGTTTDCFSFDEVFSIARNWHKRPLPAAAALTIYDHHHHHHHGHHHHHHHHHHHGHHHHDHHSEHDSHHGHEHRSDDHRHHSVGGSSHGGRGPLSHAPSIGHHSEHGSLTGSHSPRRDNLHPMHAHSVEDSEHSLLNPRVFVAYTIEEHHPLSSDGYAQMTAALRAWSSFRQKRVDTINRFAVEDNRSAEEIDLDAKIQAKLKVAYRAAKALKRKNRELAREAAKAEKALVEAKAKEQVLASGRSGQSGQSGSLVESEGGGTEGTPYKLDINLMLKKSKTDTLAAIREGEGDDEDMDFSDEENDEDYIDPVEQEISAAFETFCKFGEDFVPRIPISCLRGAFVQLFNIRIEQGWIGTVIESEDMDPTLTAFDNEQFERLYFRAMGMLQEDKRAESAGDGAEMPNVSSKSEEEALGVPIASLVTKLEGLGDDEEPGTELSARESDRLDRLLDTPGNAAQRVLSGRRDADEFVSSPLSTSSAPPKFVMKPLGLGGNAAGGGINAIRSHK